MIAHVTAPASGFPRARSPIQPARPTWGSISVSTIRNADTIVVMDHGRIVEQGDHAELLARHGLYRTLYETQFAQAEAEAV